MAEQVQAQATEEFPFIREIDLGDGSGVQVFRGKTQQELDDAMAEAIANNTRMIREQNQELRFHRRAELYEDDKPDTYQGPLEFKPRELSSAEAFAIAQKLNNPATARQGMRELLEAELGAPVDQVRERLTASDTARLAREAETAVDMFRAAHPEYRGTPQDAEEMKKFLEAHNMGWTRRNLEIAFRKLSAAGLLQLAAEGNGNGRAAAPAQREAPADSGDGVRTRPRGSVSTSIVPGGRRAPGPTSKMPSREEIDKMPLADYEKRMQTDPAFVRYVDSLR